MTIELRKLHFEGPITKYPTSFKPTVKLKCAVKAVADAWGFNETQLINRLLDKALFEIIQRENINVTYVDEPEKDVG